MTKLVFPFFFLCFFLCGLGLIVLREVYGPNLFRDEVRRAQVLNEMERFRKGH
jgi:hypothetical protein